MPIAAAPLIAAGAQLASTGANAYMQGKTNLKTRQFAEEMYFRQRADSLADWERTLPINQMKYLKEAGLNPHLVYGNGAQATDAPRAAPVQSWNPKAPEFDGGSVMSAYQNTKIQMAQQDNMEMQRKLMNQQILESISRELNNNVDTSNKAQNHQFKDAAWEYNLSALKLMNQLREKEISAKDQEYNFRRMTMSMNIQQNDLDAAIKGKTFEKAAQEILNLMASRAQTEEQTQYIKQARANLAQDNRIKQLDEKLASKNIRPGDPMYHRLFMGLLDSIFGDKPKTP